MGAARLFGVLSSSSSSGGGGGISSSTSGAAGAAGAGAPQQQAKQGSGGGSNSSSIKCQHSKGLGSRNMHASLHVRQPSLCASVATDDSDTHPAATRRQRRPSAQHVLPNLAGSRPWCMHLTPRK
jgi:hypothetical protein